MRIDIITLFPEFFTEFGRLGVCGRAITAGKASLHCWNPRDYAPPPHHLIDDKPYGGGSGMVMKAEPLLAAAASARHHNPAAVPLYLTPRGKLFNQALAGELAKESGIILLCGRYRGIDERAVELFGGREISIGNYILSGGEVAAMAIADAILRHLPGVLGNEDSLHEEAFSKEGILDAPCYTRPAEFAGKRVPEALTGGDHAAVRRWRQQAIHRLTAGQRPDLLTTENDDEK